MTLVIRLAPAAIACVLATSSLSCTQSRPSVATPESGPATATPAASPGTVRGPGASIVPSAAPTPATVAPSVAATPNQARNPAALEEGRPYRPAINPADFVTVVDNRYYPLQPGTTRVYEGGGERVEVTVTRARKRILGVATTVVRDQVFIGGELAEDTLDWFAQDRWGNVWYFGEDTKEYRNGSVASTAGSWQAGVDGAQPGVVMLGDPRVGDAYRQEYYEGEAEDMARVRAVDEIIRVPHGSFDRVLVTEDWTPLEPNLLEHKWYAPGVGLVMERLIRGGEGGIGLVDVSTGGSTE